MASSGGSAPIEFIANKKMLDLEWRFSSMPELVLIRLSRNGEQLKALLWGLLSAVEIQDHR
jgi:hypothetical protein